MFCSNSKRGESPISLRVLFLTHSLRRAREKLESEPAPTVSALLLLRGSFFVLLEQLQNGDAGLHPRQHGDTAGGARDEACARRRVREPPSGGERRGRLLAVKIVQHQGQLFDRVAPVVKR